MANPRTIRLAGSGGATQQYELAPGLLQYVQSVYVEVDNTAGADARPTLTLSEQSGVVIAKKRQGEAIPAAATGSATWALRLDDETGGGSGTQVQLAGYDVSTTDTPPQPQYNGFPLNGWSLEAGIDLLDTTSDPDNAAVLTDGIYTWHWHYRYVTAFAPQGSFASYVARFIFDLSTVPGPLFSAHEAVLPLNVFRAGTYPQASNSFRLPMHAGDTLQGPFVEHNVPAGDPNAASLLGGDCQLILLREPLKPPFPTI